MKILKRNGKYVPFEPNKILKRVQVAVENVGVDVNDVGIQHIISDSTIKVQQNLYDEITTSEIDRQLAKTIESQIPIDPEAASFTAGYILLTSLEKDLKQNNYDYLSSPYLLPEFKEKYKENKKLYKTLRKEVGIPRLTYKSASTWIKEYLLKDEKGVVVESPVDAWWRVSLHLGDNIEETQRFFKGLCEMRYTGANPVMVNSGTNKGCLISCTTMSLGDDSRDGIMSLQNKAAIHSSKGSGVGQYIGNLSSKDRVRNSGGRATGLRGYADYFIHTSEVFRQHESRRGAFALYADIWHKDILDFMPMKRGDLNPSTTNVEGFYAVCVPDLFWERFAKGEDWTLVCPREVYDVYGFWLSDYWGDDFKEKYLLVESEGRVPTKVVKTSSIMEVLIDSQTISGVPYVWNRDNANRNFQQQHLGTLKSYQLCIEYSGYHSEEFDAQCCLGSINLVSHMEYGVFNYDLLEDSVRTLARMLNRVIDLNEWNTEAAKRSGLEHRNIGIGMMGLADVFALAGWHYWSETSKDLNREIQKTIYLSALKESNQLAKETGKGMKETLVVRDPERFEFIPSKLQESLRKHGVMNQLLCCNMPTSTTSRLMNVTPSFEPFSTLLEERHTISGKYINLNPYFVKDMKKLGMWNDYMRNQVLQHNDIKKLGVPKWVEKKYLTKFEIPKKEYLEMASVRQHFIDQGQSMNMYYETADRKVISTALWLAWKLGLPTGSYYTTVKTKTGTTDVVDVIRTSSSSNKIECFGCD